MSHPVDKSNIQGGIWPRMPKEFESFLFYKIHNVNRFRNDLKEFVDEITTGEQCEERLAQISSAAKNGRPTRIDMSGINVSFTQKGLQKVGSYSLLPSLCCFYFLKGQKQLTVAQQLNLAQINDGLFEKGMYSDLIFEGADIPERLLPEFKPPPGHPSDDDSWRIDLVFIVAASSEKTLNEGIAKIETNFHLRDLNKTSMEQVVVKHGQRRPGDLRGREQ